MRALYSSNGTILAISSSAGDWLSYLTFGWFEFVGYRQLTTREDLDRVIRCINNMLAMVSTDTLRFKETYGILSVPHHAIQEIKEKILPFFLDSPRLVQESEFHRLFPAIPLNATS